MPTFTGTSANNTWTVINPGDYSFDGQGGIDTLDLGTEPISNYTITKSSDGNVHIDSISGASGAFHATLINMEIITSSNKTNRIDLATYFIDTSPPTVSSFSPAAMSSNVAPGSNIVLTFNEAIIRGTGEITISSTDGALVASYDASNSGNLLISGRTLAIDPSADLHFATGYKITLAAGSIKDLAGNNYAGSSSYTFTTAATSIISGSLGNDTFSGAGNGASFDGGSGTDTAVFNGNFASYLLSKFAGSTIVTANAGMGGSDTLMNIERIQFNDVSIALDINGTAGQAYRLYQAAFDRKPDLAGLGYWIKDMDKGSSLTTVAAGFFQSPEFQQLYGSNPSTTTLITNFYHNVLHRAPDQAGFDYWANELNTGKITPAGALASFCESTENQAQVIGAIQNGIQYTPWLG